ncbi:MAG: hypothetical protein R6V43_02295 [Halopseudomonas sp.]
MPTFRLLTAALALSALGVGATALAADHAAEHTQPTHTQGSQSDTDTGGSAQVPHTRDGAENTNPYDEAGPDAMHTDEDTSRDDVQPIDE